MKSEIAKLVIKQIREKILTNFFLFAWKAMILVIIKNMALFDIHWDCMEGD